MKFYIVENGYITASGEDDGMAPDMPRADEAARLLGSYPTPPEGYECRLKEDLTWELLALPAEETAPETGSDEEEGNDDGR
ncbi:MAG: hypothetical protein MJ070_05985 [Lachnospiraceae bacterium]|nr:hypothetical protein [Lachnospiraceae bacterium]